ncbi:MAG: M23 family metallopeptidase [Acidobacteriaceae bacterium]
MNRFFGAGMLFLFLGNVGQIWAQSQPSFIVLDPNGISRIYPPFDTPGWTLTRSSGIATHQGDDYFAQDWAAGCFSEGRKVYAPISGRIVLDPAFDQHLDGYGNTLVIADNMSGFALRLSHLEGFAPGLSNNDPVLAGQYIGRVGATGNCSPSPTCATAGGRGAHLHLALYKNVTSKHSRPIASVYFPIGPSSYAARFSYSAPVTLAKWTDPAVYAIFGQWRYLVSFAVFNDWGLNFDSSRLMFNPLANQTDTSRIPTSSYLWPPRDNSLIKSASSPAVYLEQDGRKKFLSYEVFVCRGFSFADVKVFPDNEVPRFEPAQSEFASGCRDEVRQAMSDLENSASSDSRFGGIQLGSYGFSYDWDQAWELRHFAFEFHSVPRVSYYHATLRADPSVRFVSFFDPDASAWTAWQRVF